MSSRTLRVQLPRRRTGRRNTGSEGRPRQRERNARCACPHQRHGCACALVWRLGADNNASLAKDGMARNVAWNSLPGLAFRSDREDGRCLRSVRRVSIVAEAGSRSTPVRTRSRAVQTRTGWQSALYVPYRPERDQHDSCGNRVEVGANSTDTKAVRRGTGHAPHRAWRVRRGVAARC